MLWQALPAVVVAGSAVLLVAAAVAQSRNELVARYREEAMQAFKAGTLDRATRKKQIFDIQRYLADQMYYPAGSTGILTAGLGPAVRDVSIRGNR